MKGLFSIIILLIGNGLGIFAQNNVIEGTIRQSDSISVLSGVSVYIENTTLGTASNGNGYYNLKDIPAGNHTLVISAIGYFTIAKDISIEEGESLQLDFILIEEISSLLEVTVMSGGREGIRDIPGSVYYISPKEIQQFNYTDINRTLRSVPGINIQEEDGFGLRPNIGLRGTGVERSSKITVMEDGVLMAPAPYAAPAAYYFPTIGRMQGVEILKGSSQIKYGPYTTGGAINLISTQIPDQFFGKINLSGGSFGGKNLHAFVGNKHENFGYIIETFQYSSDGFKQLANVENTGFDKKDFLAKFRVNTKENAKIYQSLTFKVGQVFENSNQTYLGLTQEDFDKNPFQLYAAAQKDEITSRQFQFSATHLVKFSEAFKIMTTAYRSDYSRNWYKLDKVRDASGKYIKIGELLDFPKKYSSLYDILTGSSSTRGDEALLVKANNRSYYAQGVQTVMTYDFDTDKIQHGIEVGVRLHQDQIDRFQWNDEFAMDNSRMKLIKPGEPGTESNRVETANALASYLQYKLKIGKLTALPGIRYENITMSRKDYGVFDPERTGVNMSTRSNSVDVWIPGIGLDYDFNSFISTFGGIHKGFAPPGSKEATLPEKSINYELGIRYNKKSVSGQVIVFMNNYSNLLGTDLEAAGGTGTNEQFNGGAVSTKGVEFQWSCDLLSGFKKSKFGIPLTVTYTYTDARFKNDFDSEFEGWGQVSAGDHFPYLANNQFAVIVGLEHRQFSINLSGRYMDEMRTVPGEGDILANERTDAYFIVDLSLNYRLHANITLFSSVTNVTDQVYIVARRPAGLRPGLPRAFNVGLKSML